MAQKTGKEEPEFKAVPETLTLCVNNCGLTGNPATNNMCQKCFNNNAAVAFAAARSTSSSSRPPTRDLKRPDRTPEPQQSKPANREVNRCSGCRRKVGLTGFRCRCGDLFCADHRYSDRHDCTYDYKAAGRQAIARDNPVVKAAKIVKL